MNGKRCCSVIIFACDDLFHFRRAYIEITRHRVLRWGRIKVRQQRLGHAEGSPITETVYTHVVSEDGKRIAAQLGDAVWGILDPSWTGNKNGSGLEHPKPLILN